MKWVILLQKTAQDQLFTVVAGQRLKGAVRRLLVTADAGFVTRGVGEITLAFEGIPDTRHYGLTRRSGGREPWYQRGTEMRNERQISLVSADELAQAARRMEIDRIEPEWIGANMVIEGVPHLSMLPPRTLLFIDGGATLRIDGQNAPCRFAGAEIARHYPDREGLDLLFPKEARRLRGLVAWVEKPGQVVEGAAVKVHVPEQWIYQKD